MLGVRIHHDAIVIAPFLPADPSADAGGGLGYWLKGAVPVVGGATLDVAITAAGVIEVYAPQSASAGRTAIELRLSEQLVSRIAARVGALAFTQLIISAGTGPGSNTTTMDLDFHSHAHGPWDESTGRRCGVHVISLSAGARYSLSFMASKLPSASASASASAPPFPPPSYPAVFLQRDEETRGNWLGMYGSAGYALFSYDGAYRHRVSLPPWVAAINQSFGNAISGPWPMSDPTDVRALQDPRNASSRAIGQWYVLCCFQVRSKQQHFHVRFTAGCRCVTKWGDPSFPLDIYLQPSAEGTPYQLAVYMVDFDGRGRRCVLPAV